MTPRVKRRLWYIGGGAVVIIVAVMIALMLERSLSPSVLAILQKMDSESRLVTWLDDQGLSYTRQDLVDEVGCAYEIDYPQIFGRRLLIWENHEKVGEIFAYEFSYTSHLISWLDWCEVD